FVTDLVASPEARSMPGLQATVHLAGTYLAELARDPRRNLAILVLTVASIREMPELQPAISQLNDGLRRGVADLLGRGIADGSGRPGTDISAAATAIVALLPAATPHGLAGPGMEPTRLFPVIVLLSLVTVEYGGWALLGFLTGRGALGDFRERFFAAGHAHAGVLLVLSLAYFVYLGRAGYSASVQWLAGAL